MSSENERVLNETAKKALDVAREQVLSEIDKESRPAAEEVRKAANKLVAYATELQNKYGPTVMDSLSTLDVENEQSVLEFSRDYIKQSNEYGNLMNRVFYFQNKVNAFMGRKIIMTFVAISKISGNVTLYNMENSVKDLNIERAAESRGGHLVGRYTSMEKIKEASRGLENSAYKDKDTLDRTFQEVWQRYRISKDKLKLRGAAYILWKSRGEWDGAWISGSGPLGEAYVAFFLNNYKFNSAIEASVRTFMTNKRYGAINADNASGFLKGDVVKGAAQFGVKTLGAQTMSYLEVIEYAKEILQTVDIEKYLNDLEEKLYSKEKESNMVKLLEKTLGEEVLEVQKEVEKRINKIGARFKKDGKVLIAELT